MLYALFLLWMKSIKIPKQHLNWLDGIRSDIGCTWEQFFKNLHNNKDELIKLSHEPFAWETIAKCTIESQMDLWLLNIHNNLPLILEKESIMTLPKVNEPVLCLGNGPSLAENMDLIKEFKGTIMCCDINLVKLLHAGIVPKYVLSIDSHDWYMEFINNDLVDEFASQITLVCCATASPKLLARWPGEIRFFSSYIDDSDNPLSVSKAIITITDLPSMQTDGNAGSAMWFLAAFLKAKPIVLLGIDFAYKDGIKFENTTIWPYINQLPQQDILDCFCWETNPFGNKVITDCSFSSTRHTTHSWIASEKTVETIQCSEYTIMHEWPLKLMTFEEYLDGQIAI